MCERWFGANAFRSFVVPRAESFAVACDMDRPFHGTRYFTSTTRSEYVAGSARPEWEFMGDGKPASFFCGS